MPRAVVTGGAGFLGSHLCELLLGHGWHVVAVDDFSTGSRANVAHLLERLDFELVEHDVVQGIPVEGQVDAVLHLASPASPPVYLDRPIPTLEVGSIGTQNALDLACKHDGARFLLASTSEIYGDPLVHPQPESYWGNVNPIGPRSVYDEAKRYAEAMTMAYHRAHDVDTKIVRVFNSILADEQVVYDDGTTLRREPVEALAERLGGSTILRGYTVPAFDGRARVSCRTAEALVAHPPAGKCYEVATRYGRTIRVTGDHSLFVEGPDGLPVAKQVSQLRRGDRVAIAARVSVPERDRTEMSVPALWAEWKRSGWDLFITQPGLGAEAWDRRAELRGIVAGRRRPNGSHWRASIESMLRRWRTTDELPLAALDALGIRMRPDARCRARFGSGVPLPVGIRVTDELLWFLGLFVAEGSWHQSRSDAFVTICCDIAVLDRAAKVVERDLGLHVVRAPGSPVRGPALFVHSKLFLEILRSLGLIENDKRIPGWVLGLPLSRLKWFLEGYREGDGVHSGGKFAEQQRHEFSTTSTCLKDDLILAFARFGLVASVGHYVTHLRQKTGDREYPSWRLTLGRVAPWSPLEWDTGVTQVLQSRRTGDIVWAAIREIQEVEPTALVYDFCVPGAENFLAGTAVMAHNTYGPRLRAGDGRVVSNFLAQALRGEPLTVYGDGTQTRSFCYVSDEVAGIIALLESDHVGPMNIGNPDEFTIVELANAVREVVGVDVSLRFEPLPSDDPRQRRPDISLARSVLGWRPTVDLREGLARTLDAYRRAGGIT
jgi:UDP-glucuronate decarboxylase